MKTSLSYLPQIKQEQILQVADIIKDVANPHKIILFGSHATGTWVEDKYFENGINFEYISDYDFLIVTKNSTDKEYDVLDKITNRSRHLFKTPVNAIIHDIKYINEGLEIGQYFFADIINEGVLVYDSNTIEFSTPRQLVDAEKKIISQEYYDRWFFTGVDFLEGASFYFDKNKNNMAVFMLHQSVERFYNTVLLVFTGYKPKTHNLDKLRQYTKHLSQDLFSIFPHPVEDKETEHLFDLLKKGYIDARYKIDFLISEKELTRLISLVNQFQLIVKNMCEEKIKQFSKA